MDLQTTAQNIAQYYFRPPMGKPVAVASDPDKLELARALVTVLEDLGNPTILPVLEGDIPAMRQGLERLLDDEEIALAIFASHFMWAELGLNERFTMRNRLPSLVGLANPIFFDAVTPLDSLLRLYGADPQAIYDFIEGLRRNLDDHAFTRLTTPAGTDLRFTARNWEPWGWEMMTCPVEDSINGTLVVDAGVFFGTVNQPIELTIEGGKLTAMRALDRDDEVFRQYRQWMMETMEENAANAQLAEVGIGANPGAQISGVVMESESVQGTVHVCFGDNRMFAGMGGSNASNWHGGTVIMKAPRFE